MNTAHPAVPTPLGEDGAGDQCIPFNVSQIKSHTPKKDEEHCYVLGSPPERRVTPECKNLNLELIIAMENNYIFFLCLIWEEKLPTQGSCEDRIGSVITSREEKVKCASI